jgi:hypothetical protein
MLILIALALALPIVAIGVIFKSRKAVIFAALIMAGIGLATGNPYFAGIDVVAVIGGSFLALNFCESGQKDGLLQKLGQMPNKKTSDNQIDGVYNDQTSMSKDDRALLDKYLSFYEELELGIRKPVSDAQTHFVDVTKGIAAPRTQHERAFLKYIQNRRTD